MGVNQKLLDNAARKLRVRSKSVWDHYIGASRTREIVAWSIAGLATLTAFIAITTVSRYASSIVYVTTTNTVDRYGQVLARNAVLQRASEDTLAHNVIDAFFKDTFTVWNSIIAMQANAAEAQSLSGSTVVTALIRGYWSQNSPLGPNGSWKAPVAEQVVKITSVVARGSTQNGIEYTVEFTLTRVLIDGGYPTQPQLYTSDIILAPKGESTGSNPGGLLVTHLSYSEVK